MAILRYSSFSLVFYGFGPTFWLSDRLWVPRLCEKKKQLYTLKVYFILNILRKKNFKKKIKKLAQPWKFSVEPSEAI